MIYSLKLKVQSFNNESGDVKDGHLKAKFWPSYMLITPDRQRSKTLLTIVEHGSNIARNSVLDLSLAPVRRHGNRKLFLTFFDLRSSIVFKCFRLPPIRCGNGTLLPSGLSMLCVFFYCATVIA